MSTMMNSERRLRGEAEGARRATGVSSRGARLGNPGSNLGQHAGENFQPQVRLVAQSVRAALDDADLVVQSFHKAERYLVLRFAVGGDSVPMPIDHRGEF